MWEWSKSSLKPLDRLTLPPKRGSSEKTSPSDNPAENIPSPEQMQTLLKKRLDRLNLKNIVLRQCTYHPHTWDEMSRDFDNLQRIRKSFLKLIGYSRRAECLRIGLDEEDINLLKNKRSPENYNIHIKIPLDFGGSLSLENLSLIKSHPTHDQIHRLIEDQIGSGFLKKHKIIYIPWFEGNFYYE